MQRIAEVSCFQPMTSIILPGPDFATFQNSLSPTFSQGLTDSPPTPIQFIVNSHITALIKMMSPQTLMLIIIICNCVLVYCNLIFTIHRFIWTNRLCNTLQETRRRLGDEERPEERQPLQQQVSDFRSYGATERVEATTPSKENSPQNTEKQCIEHHRT